MHACMHACLAAALGALAEFDGLALVRWAALWGLAASDVGHPADTAVMSAAAPLADVMITLGARDFSQPPGLLPRPRLAADHRRRPVRGIELRGVVVALFPLAQLARDGNTEPDLVQRRHPLHHRDHGRRSGGSRSAGRANAQRRCPRDQRAHRCRVLHRPVGLPLRPGRQLLRDHVGRAK